MWIVPKNEQNKTSKTTVKLQWLFTLVEHPFSVNNFGFTCPLCLCQWSLGQKKLVPEIPLQCVRTASVGFPVGTHLLPCTLMYATGDGVHCMWCMSDAVVVRLDTLKGESVDSAQLQFSICAVLTQTCFSLYVCVCVRQSWHLPILRSQQWLTCETETDEVLPQSYQMDLKLDFVFYLAGEKYAHSLPQTF